MYSLSNDILLRIGADVLLAFCWRYARRWKWETIGTVFSRLFEGVSSGSLEVRAQADVLPYGCSPRAQVTRGIGSTSRAQGARSLEDGDKDHGSSVMYVMEQPMRLSN